MKSFGFLPKFLKENPTQPAIKRPFFHQKYTLVIFPNTTTIATVSSSRKKHEGGIREAKGLLKLSKKNPLKKYQPLKLDKAINLQELLQKDRNRY